MRNVTINTRIQGKDEVFKMFSLAYSTGHPILLEGPPGIGKTEMVIDFIRAVAPKNSEGKVSRKSIYILETDEGTRSSQIKGVVDIKKLLQENVYHINAPIVEAEGIVINEVDKANTPIRNSLLGIMNERMLFDGHEIKKCKWKLFCGTCNSIPNEEKEAPFWDRFVLKMKLGRVTPGKLVEIVKENKPRKKLDVIVPEAGEVAKIAGSISSKVLEKFVQFNYSQLTDRTMSFVSELIAATSCIYQLDEKRAAVKVCEMLTTGAHSTSFAKELEPEEVSEIRERIDMLNQITDEDLLEEKVEELKKDLKSLISTSGHLLSKSDLNALGNQLATTLENHPLVAVTNSRLDGAMSEASSEESWTAVDDDSKFNI